MKRDPHKLKIPEHDWAPGLVWCLRCGKTYQQVELGAECVTDGQIADREQAHALSRVYGRLRRAADR